MASEVTTPPAKALQRSPPPRPCKKQKTEVTLRSRGGPLTSMYRKERALTNKLRGRVSMLELQRSVCRKENKRLQLLLAKARTDLVFTKMKLRTTQKQLDAGTKSLVHANEMVGQYAGLSHLQREHIAHVRKLTGVMPSFSQHMAALDQAESAIQFPFEPESEEEGHGIEVN